MAGNVNPLVMPTNQVPPALQHAAQPATPAPPAQQNGVNGMPPMPQGMPNTGLRQFSDWFTSGGINPQGWMSLGGAPNTDYLNRGTWTSGTTDPTQVQTNGDPYSQAQPFIDNAYSQATRTLDPQWQQQSAAFDQQMVNQGIQPGSAAYQTAKQQFDQSKNDAYSQAQSNAMTQGLQAQAQSFGQGLSQSQLANQLSQALIQANSGYAGNQLQGNQGIMQALLGGTSGIVGNMLGADASRASSAASNASARMNSQNAYNLGMAQLGQTASQNDFGNLMQLLGMGQGQTQYNNNLIGQDQTRNQSFFGMMPGGSGNNIDVQNPYNNYYQGQLYQNQYGNNQANANNQNMANYAGLLASFFGG